MEKQQRQNPLKNYFRQFKLYLKLPSGKDYYEPNIAELTESGEIGVMPMTGKDELILKNPDALFNGEALIEVIKSCVPGVKDAKKLVTNDIDALITAIRYATFNDSLETEINCPKCNHTNLFKIDLQYSLDNMSFLDPEYVVNLESGLSVFIKPYGFNEVVTGLHAQLEQRKITRAIENESLTEEQRLHMFSTAFSELSVITYDLMVSSVVKVVDENNNVNVNNKDDIAEFLQNIDKKSVDQISDLITSINQIGIKKTFTAKCEKCEHNWESEIDFNPVNFS